MLFHSAVPHDPAIDAWMQAHPGPLGELARHWFAVMRRCGPDIRELLHDKHPTACVGEAAFCYVNVFTAHVNVGFFLGAELADPDGLLEGEGKFMRHVKLRPQTPIAAGALEALIRRACEDMRVRLATSRLPPAETETP